ncbi:MAG: SpoIIE family protein phosphatase [bacterium]|nr:SpoIIE family protein phosphatase [bacterium]
MKIVVIIQFVISILIVQIISPANIFGKNNIRTSDSGIVELTEDWHYHRGDLAFNNEGEPETGIDWTRFRYTGNPMKQGNCRIIWLKTKLPAGEWESPSLCLEGLYQVIEVYLDGKSLYTFGTIDENGMAEYPGSSFHIIPLSPGFAGKNIYFRIYSDYHSIGMYGKVRAGPQTGLVLTLLREKAVYAIQGIIFLFIGLFSIGVFIFNRKQKAFLAFSMVAIAIGIAVITRSRILLLFLDVPLLLINIQLTASFIIPVGISILLETLFGRGYKSMIRRLWQCNLLFILCLFLMKAFHISSLMSMLPFFQKSMIVVIPALLTVLAVLVYRGNTEAKIFLTGIGVFALFTIYDILCDLKILPRVGQLISWGFFFMVLTILIALIYRVYSIQKEAQLNLELKVAERTVELTQANDKLKEMDQIKTNFFANISHEIRTPLTLILSPIEFVLYKEKNIEVDPGFLKTIYKNALRLLRLINNLLDFSRIEAGRIQMHISEINMIDFLKNYIASVFSTAVSNNVIISLIAEQEEIPVFLDAEKADKIIMNLLSNALKFTPDGGKIDIAVSSDKNNCYVKITDTGIGIKEQDREIIFDRFSQVNSSSMKQYEGTGIGLSLAKELIEMHNGTISVTSKHYEDFPDNHGTSFTVTFPLGKEQWEGKEQVTFQQEQDHRQQVTGSGKMLDLERDEVEESIEYSHTDENKKIILLVEDNADMRQFVKTLLKEFYTVHTACNGKEALEKIEEILPELILSDVMMPEMNGYELTQRVKNDPILKNIPIILLTAKAETADTIEGFEHGADDYVAKPFNSQELLIRINSIFTLKENERKLFERNVTIEKELEIARLLQQKLLPGSLPEIPGYNSHVEYIPMDKVGGDLYNFFDDDDTIELFMADVSGHGLPGAFLSTITKMALESIEARRSPGTVLEKVNKIICKFTVLGNYVTTFFCTIDKKTNVMNYCNGGHFPPMVYREKTNEIFDLIDLKSKNPPLGWFENKTYSEITFQLEPADRLILYTDGIFECRNTIDEEYGIERFAQFCRSHRGLSPAEFTESIFNHVKDFAGSEHFDDDVCLLIFDVL